MTRDLFRERINAFEETMRAKPAGAEGFPGTYQPVTRGPGVRQRGAFDPALQHFPHGYVAGEPDFADPATGARWRAARRTAMHHVLAAIAGSTCGEHLVLRGSVLMRAWFGDHAREPGDLDFVVTPASMAMEGTEGRDLVDGIVNAVRRFPPAGDVRVDADEVSTAEIWTYERVPGRRLVFPWYAPDLPPGTVQLDAVFNEELPEPPADTPVPVADGAEPVLVRAVSPQLSLVWKLLWLATDSYPQGKDLYDATLLAEFTTVPWHRVTEALIPELGDRAGEFTPDSVRHVRPDWDNFRDQYPGFGDAGEEWERRLEAALQRSYAG
ncbi:nucleotidyl transferase AbiEii/AbiGii toxin family protein [Micromonospora sp. U56]|uniref:nucleotidyl transferase AbiEii/AbiGii toxin family protein n=1 Tax=Micromonospora sp. U56 TaxID=2824900 RepID=UPI001FFD85F9|nr:nucleotidyl transferase AbiEii/AbiGii toxin family protein [Micromonospora sp. U56]